MNYLIELWLSLTVPSFMGVISLVYGIYIMFFKGKKRKCENLNSAMKHRIDVISFFVWGLLITTFRVLQFTVADDTVVKTIGVVFGIINVIILLIKIRVYIRSIKQYN